MTHSYKLQRQPSRVTAGKRMFTDPLADGRTVWAKRWRDIVLLHADDIGGYDTLSEAQLSICRRAAVLECELESAEGRLSAGLPVDIELYARLAARLCRLLELIGIKRLSKPLDPLSEFAKAVEGYAAAPIDDDGDGSDDEPLAIEQGLDRTEPGEA